MKASTERLAQSQNERTGLWQRQIALLIVCIAVFLDALDTSIVNVALPSIQGNLHLSTLDLPWVPGAYFLTYGGFLLLGGRAADLLGRRRIFLIGTALFGIASFICGLANSGWLLLVARGLQGIGAALTLPSAISIITTTFAEGQERNRALSIFSATGASGFSIGLVLGGVLTTFINWHWVFFVNLPFVLLILLFSRAFIKESRLTIAARSYDIAGAVTVTAGLLLLGYVITQANQPGATILKTAGLLALTLFILALFILIEWRSQAPLIPLRIFRSRTTCAANLTSLMLLGPFFGFLLIAAIYLQDILHYSPVQASLALLPGSATTVLVARWIAPQLINRLGVRLSAGLGLLCLMSGIALFARIGPDSDYVWTILPPMLLVMGLGIGIGYPTLAIAAVSGIANAEQGLAAGLQGTSLQTGGGLWLTITAAVVAMNTISVQGAASTATQLNGFHVGLLVAAAGAGLGALIAYAGIAEPAAGLSPATQALIEDELPL